MLAMPSSEAAYRPHRFPAASPWSNSMTDYPEIHQYTYPARPLPPDHKARPHPDVFQNGITRHSQDNTSSFHAGSRAFIDHDDLLAPQRSDALSNSSSPPSDTSERAQQLLEAHSAASSSAQSSDPGASSPSTSAGASDFASHDSSYAPKSLLSEALDADLDATPVRSKSTNEAPGANGAAPESGHRHHSSLSSPLSPLVEPFSPHTGSTPMPALSVYHASPGAADLQHQRSSTSLASLASGTSEPRAPGFESRSPSTTGSVSSGVTVHSLYAPQYNEANVNGLLADLGSPNSVTQAAFASLGAQLATQERGAHIPSSKSQDAGSSTSEEISTIFVVGFPEDMQEREFQNMFIFSPGFEAATLKTPEASSSTSSSSRDGGGKYNSAMDGFNMPFGNYNDDGYGGLNPRPLPSTLDREKDAANAQRRQTIGFAKFRTRQEAVDAVAVLSGRRVDAEKDCVLKAEMAKKNLHTKRGLANEYSNPSSSTVGVGNAAGNNSLPHSVLALGQHNLAVAAALSPQVIATALAQQQVQRDPTALAVLMRDQDHRDQRDVRSHQQQSAAFDAFHSVPPPSSSPTYPRGSVDAGSAVAQADPRYNAYGSREHRESITSSSSSAPYFRPGSASRETNNFGKSLLQQLDTETPFASSSPSSAIGQTSDGYTRHAFYSSAGLDEPTSQSYTGLGSVHAASNLNSRIQGLSLNTGLAPRERPTSPLSGGLTSPRGTNPADMNPPINTLYVGGLPAVLPSLTGPMSASHLEDSLRAVFSRSPGFKRLCFRQKSNGPMSFVEYENVELATRALHDLYGHTLGGLVKGGIRLSYSKNPLGVRSGSVSTPTSSHTPLSPSSNNFSTFLGGSDPYLTNNTPTPNANISRRLGHDAPLNGYQQTYRAHTPRSATSPPPVSPGQTSTFSPFGEMSRGIF